MSKLEKSTRINNLLRIDSMREYSAKRADDHQITEGARAMSHANARALSWLMGEYHYYTSMNFIQRLKFLFTRRSTNDR